jgi:hypothetical protein
MAVAFAALLRDRAQRTALADGAGAAAARLSPAAHLARLERVLELARR